MKKIEIVHSEAALQQIKKCCQEMACLGFTSMNVETGFGHNYGAFFRDEISAQYYTFILVAEQDFEAAMHKLESVLSMKQVLTFTSPVQMLQHT